MWVFDDVIFLPFFHQVIRAGGWEPEVEQEIMYSRPELRGQKSFVNLTNLGPTKIKIRQNIDKVKKFSTITIYSGLAFSKVYKYWCEEKRKFLSLFYLIFLDWKLAGWGRKGWSVRCVWPTLKYFLFYWETWNIMINKIDRSDRQVERKYVRVFSGLPWGSQQCKVAMNVVFPERFFYCCSCSDISDWRLE